MPDTDIPPGTNGPWHALDADYPAGMIWEGTMFAPGRDEAVWRRQDALEVVGPPGPLDDETAPDYTWRVTNSGRRVYTGEARVRSKRPGAQQMAYQTGFWARWDRGERWVARGGEVAGERFPDGLPIRSGGGEGQVLGREGSAPTPVPAEMRIVSMREHNRGGFGDLARHPQVPVPSTAIAVDAHVDGEYEIDTDFPTTITPTPHPPAVIAAQNDLVSDSTPPKTSPPRVITTWDDDNLLSLWKWKVIRKKGFEPMLAHFEGQTVQSLRQAWTTHRVRCGELGRAWRGAGSGS
ncbi:hypothetical protein ST47_g8827 [Ascochyta rabiei]|uniref:Uncharacterized protein n=1 Tax=Didymella rabiei TaxID=5454 RepID=A0A162YF20_DIDRA|nr:hypothetical protein ST47_g8827 [Ascochyta rabiei]